MWMGRGSNAYKSLFQPIPRHSNLRLMYGRTYRGIRSKPLKMRIGYNLNNQYNHQLNQRKENSLSSCIISLFPFSQSTFSFLIPFVFHLLFFFFLVADTKLYKRLCPSVRWSVRQHESKSGKMSIFENFLRMFECEWGNGGWTPLPTRPQRYCDPASLVLLLFFLLLSSILSFCLILSLFPLIDSSPEISSFFFSKFPFCEQDQFLLILANSFRFFCPNFF